MPSCAKSQGIALHFETCKICITENKRAAVQCELNNWNNLERSKSCMHEVLLLHSTLLGIINSTHLQVWGGGGGEGW